ncbi:MAG: 1-acyl-sn-glycerol-3-phosphate acyltransferase [Bacteroidia bacterium]|nr:1-acyl-sn-glycerol-3-phosphate acyltransferase [Bacteroidia bacterium]
MIWHILKFWTSFLLPVFYKKIQVKNIAYMQVKGPVIIAMNHPNAFTDPVALTMACYPPRLKYLARGDAFKPGIISWLLERIGIVPIFRIQDGGKEGLKKNEDAYRKINQLLKKNAKVIIFAEGLCVQERRLRPLKKGVARMVFGAYEYLCTENLVVVPVGINYSRPDKFRSNLFYNIGEPIAVRDFIDEYHANPAKGNNKLLAYLEPQLKDLITHINNPADDEAVYMLEKLCKKDLVNKMGLNYSNLDHQLTALRELTEKVNQASAQNNPALDEFKIKGREYFSTLDKNKLRDWLIAPTQNKHVTYPLLLLRYLLVVMGLPFYILGLIGNLPPLFVTDRLTRKIIKAREFYSSIGLGVGMVVFVLNYMLWFFIPYSFSPNILIPLVSVFVLALSGAFCLYYHPFLLKTLGIGRILTNKVLAQDLARQRGTLMQLINKF